MFHAIRSVLLLTGALLLATAAVFAEAQAPPPPPATAAEPADPTLGITFDVVSIRPVEELHNGQVTNPPDGDGITIQNYTLFDILRWNFKLGNFWREDQFDGIPRWFITDNYDIRAKVAEADIPTWQKLPEGSRRLVFRKLLADRFHLVTHFIDVDSPVYNLVIARGGLKIAEAKPGEISPYAFHMPGDPSTPYSGPGITMRPRQGGGYLTVMQQMHMSALATSFLTDQLGRQVIDKTCLTGAYNFALDFSHEPLSAGPPGALDPNPAVGASDPSGPSIFTALQQQLGLKLEPARGPVRHLVIDHLERPALN